MGSICAKVGSCEILATFEGMFAEIDYIVEDGGAEEKYEVR